MSMMTEIKHKVNNDADDMIDDNDNDDEDDDVIMVHIHLYHVKLIIIILFHGDIRDLCCL